MWLAVASVALLPTGESAVGGQRAGSARDWAALFRRRNVLVMLLVMTALQASHAAHYTFGAIRFANLGASPTLVSALLELAPAGEMVVLWLAPRIERRLSVTQPLHGPSFAIAQVPFVQFLTEEVPPRLAGAVQGMMTALAVGLGTATMTALAGVLWDSLRRQRHVTQKLGDVGTFHGL